MEKRIFTLETYTDRHFLSFPLKVLDPITCQILAGLNDVLAHFARFRVTEISRAVSADGELKIEK